MRAIRVKLFFDKTNVTAAFYTSQPDSRQVVDVRIETHVLIQVMRGDVVTPHRLEVALAVAHNDLGLAFHQNSERMRIKCEMREQAVQQDQDHASAYSGKERCRTIDCTRKHRRKNYQ